MAATIRVHNLAKELGVPSKVIIDKCAAEGIELKNHMAVVSAGLSESIREWFADAGTDHHSAIEVADKIDVATIRKPSKRKSTDSAHHDDDKEGGEATATAEAPVAEPPVEERIPQKVVVAPGPVETVTPEVLKPAAAKVAAPAVEPVAPKTEPLPTPDVSLDAPGGVAPPSVASPKIVMPPPAAPPASPDGAEHLAARHPIPMPAPPLTPKRQPIPMPPDPVKPAGERLVPKPAELKGPRVVRIEAPEPMRPLRPRPPGPGGSPGPDSRPTTPDAPGVGTRRKGDPRRTAEEEELARKAGVRSPRRHGAKHDSEEIVRERVREFSEQDILEQKERLASATGSGLRERRAAEQRRQSQPMHPSAKRTVPEEFEVEVPCTVREMASRLGMGQGALLKKLMDHLGTIVGVNHVIDADMVEMLAMELGVQVKITRAKTAFERLEEEFASRERKHLKPRPPVVAMLGHVDHGKTSLLDAIRNARVAAGEAGGITQHIGAYRLKRGSWDVTFLDTPGHQAFTAMRARGAQMTDVVVLVVAADDGLMPQTVEAINHAKAANVTIVVALNKIDLPGVDVNRIYGQLVEQGLTPTEWGGTTDVMKTSATKGTGVEELISHLSTLSELLDLKADPTVPVEGIVIEAQMREGQGVVAQVLVKEGTLKPGQNILCGPAFGRVRLLRDDLGKRLTEAPPGTPVEVTGLDVLPQAGDKLLELKDLSRAKDIATEAAVKRRELSLAATRKVRRLEDIVTESDQEEIPDLNIILKADVRGSLDVLIQEFAKFPTDKARLKVLHSAVGAISEADVALAQASKATIIGFSVIAEDPARRLADQVGVEIRTYRIIYEIMADIEKALLGLLEPDTKHEVRGTAEVRRVFPVSKLGAIAGCLVSDGVINRNHRVRLVRDGRIILDNGTIESLKRFKDDAREVKAGLECGIKIANFNDIKPQDLIQAFEVVEVAQTL